MTTSTPAALLLDLAERRKKLRMPLKVLCQHSELSRAAVCRLLRGDYTRSRDLRTSSRWLKPSVTISFQAETGDDL